jgi:hypothetical protein
MHERLSNEDYYLGKEYKFEEEKKELKTIAKEARRKRRARDNTLQHLREAHGSYNFD